MTQDGSRHWLRVVSGAMSVVHGVAFGAHRCYRPDSFNMFQHHRHQTTAQRESVLVLVQPPRGSHAETFVQRSSLGSGASEPRPFFVLEQVGAALCVVMLGCSCFDTRAHTTSGSFALCTRLTCHKSKL